MKKFKKILLILLILGIMGGGIGFYLAMKVAPTAADSKPEKSFTSEQIIAEFEKNPTLADSLYRDKNIAVQGKVKKMDIGSLIIEAGISAEISCTFDSAQWAKNNTSFTEGKMVNIKGIYFAHDGFSKSSDEDDMLSDMGKIIKLKTCAINEK